MNKNSISIFLLILLAATGCARREEANPEAAIGAKTSEAELESETLLPVATIAPVTVQVTLSPEAKALLTSKSEKMLVVATYSGDPKISEQAQKMADASGVIKLGDNTLNLDSSGSVTFQDDVIDKTKLDYIVGEVQLTINVTSTKNSAQENLLSCPFYWETLADASKNTVKINCEPLSDAIN